MTLPYLLHYSCDTSACPYLPNQTAELPKYLSKASIEPTQFDELMENGFRRSGSLYYKTNCRECSACQPIRVDIGKFQPNRSQRRALANSSLFNFRVGTPTVDEHRVELFNQHQIQRRLAKSNEGVTELEYSFFLLHSSNPSWELSVWHEDRLVAISITDVGATCLSAVYCFYDPNYLKWSLGTVCILMQIEIAKAMQSKWLYLGFYVAGNKHLNYKSNFKPHQMRIDGVWQ